MPLSSLDPPQRIARTLVLTILAISITSALFSPPMMAQKGVLFHRLDSIDRVFAANPNNDTILILCLNAKALYLQKLDSNEAALEATRMQYVIAQRLGWRDGIVAAMKGMIARYDALDQPLTQFAWIDTLERFATVHNRPKVHLDVAVDRSKWYFDRGDHYRALHLLEDQLPYARELDPINRLPNFISNLAGINFRLERYDHALAYARENLQHAYETDKLDRVGNMLRVIALCENELGRSDSAFVHIHASSRHAAELPDHGLMGLNDQFLGNYFGDSKERFDLDSALHWAHKALLEFDPGSDRSEIQRTRLNIAEYYLNAFSHDAKGSQEDHLDSAMAYMRLAAHDMDRWVEPNVRDKLYILHAQHALAEGRSEIALAYADSGLAFPDTASIAGADLRLNGRKDELTGIKRSIQFDLAAARERWNLAGKVMLAYVVILVGFIIAYLRLKQRRKEMARWIFRITGVIVFHWVCIDMHGLIHHAVGDSFLLILAGLSVIGIIADIGLRRLEEKL